MEAVAGAFVGVGKMSGFVTGAAMIAVLAGLGSLVAEVDHRPLQQAQRQSSQGQVVYFETYTAKSESITKALENISENSDVSLKYNEGMLNSLKNIEGLWWEFLNCN